MSWRSSLSSSTKLAASVPIFDPAGFDYSVPTSSLSPPRYWQLKMEAHKKLFQREEEEVRGGRGVRVKRGGRRRS